MDKTTINEILELNRHFYESYAKEFSVTRVAPWPGWAKLLPYLPEFKKCRIVDLGCGNGRFFKFVSENLKNITSYIGIDVSQNLIDEANMIFSSEIEHNKAKFIVADFLNDSILETYVKSADLVCGFGIMHHIPTEELRTSFVKTILNTLSKNKILILTFWTSQPDKSRIIRDFGNNDYYLQWGNNSKDFRFVHIFNEKEIETLSRNLEQNGIKLIKKYYADGKDNKANLYIIWEKL